MSHAHKFAHLLSIELRLHREELNALPDLRSRQRRLVELNVIEQVITLIFNFILAVEAQSFTMINLIFSVLRRYILLLFDPFLLLTIM